VPGDIFRSSFPLPENFSFLKSLKLKTILTLVPEPFPPEYVEFMEANGIRQEVILIPANKETIKIDSPAMIKALGVVLDKANHPILIHCNKGKHRTGCVVACFRKIQGESLDSVLTEYHAYADPKARILDEIFVKDFDERTLLWLAAENGYLPPDEPGSESPALPLVSRTRM
jgi:tyrosine-protein phosphatase SIW14